MCEQPLIKLPAQKTKAFKLQQQQTRKILNGTNEKGADDKKETQVLLASRKKEDNVKGPTKNWLAKLGKCDSCVSF